MNFETLLGKRYQGRLAGILVEISNKPSKEGHQNIELLEDYARKITTL
ncbi:MAG: hypothetical protein U5K55_05475 [Aliarcobacter sp.]|nr:hypothetical protein [Aliarcobacter sp.]